MAAGLSEIYELREFHPAEPSSGSPSAALRLPRNGITGERVFRQKKYADRGVLRRVAVIPEGNVYDRASFQNGIGNMRTWQGGDEAQGYSER